MRKIFDILISTSFQKGCSELLQTLVAEHNVLYIKYSKSHLKPKFHYLLYYHSMMDKFGSLILLWSMRFEAKHRMSKIAATLQVIVAIFAKLLLIGINYSSMAYLLKDH